MPESIQTFEGGMNSDLSPVFQKPGTYVNAINIELLSDALQGSIAISNSKGNKLQKAIPNVGAIFKLEILANGSSTITINGIVSATSFVVTSSTIYKDLYDFILADANFNLTNVNIYYSDTRVIIVPTPSTTLTVAVSNAAVLVGGTTPYIPAQTNLQAIGYSIINNDIYIFSTNCVNIDPQTNGGGYGQIWKFNYDNINYDATLATMTLIYSADLSFTTYYNIPQTGQVPRYENAGIQRIFWSDFYNKVRTINVVDPQVFALDPSLLELIPATDFDIAIMQDIQSGGSAIKAGVYQVAYRLTNVGGAVTNFSQVSNMIFTAVGNEATETFGNGFASYVGPDINTTVNKIITWQINNLDIDYDRIQIALIFRDVLNNPPVVNLIYDDGLNGNDSYTFVYDGSQTLTPISYSDFLLLSSSLTHAKTLSTKDNRLIFGNVKNAASGAGDINYDARAYRWDITGTGFQIINNGALSGTLTSADYANIIETNDAINPSYIPSTDPNYINGYFYKPNTNLGGEGPNISYEFYTIDISTDRNAGPTPFEVIDDQAAPWRSTNPRFELVQGVDLNLNVFSIDNQNQPDLQVYPTRFPNPINDGFKYPPISSLYRGYQRGEIYRFGIQFYDKSKNPYFVKWIGDIKFPDFWDVNTNAVYEDGTTAPHSDFRSSHVANKVGYLECFVRTLGILFTVNNINSIKDKISGYSIVRVQREVNDRTIVSQGYLSRLIIADNNQIYTVSPADGSGGNTLNLSYGSEDRHKNFFITPDFCAANNVDSLQIGDYLNVKSQVTAANSDGSMVFGGGDPYYYYKNYNCANNTNTPKTLLTDNVLLVGYAGTQTAGVYPVNNYDYDTGAPDYTISHSIGNQAYYFETNNDAIDYSGVVGGDQLICNIERTLTSQYGGNTYSQRSNNQYISCAHFQPVRVASPDSYTFQIFAGDIFMNMYDSCRWAKNWGTTGRGLASPKISTTFFLPIESVVNTELRNGTYMNRDIALSYDNPGAEMHETYYYNNVYSSENTTVLYYPKPDPFILNNEFVNRFYASDIKINGELTDSWSIIRENNYWDVEGTYGPINSSLIMNDKLYFWQDRAFGIMEVNPRTVVQDINDTSLQIGTGLPLQRHDYISTTVGTKHQGSTICSDRKVYWYDTNTKKIYTFSAEGINPFSDIKGMYSYLTNNLTGQIQNIDKPIYVSTTLGTNGISATYDYQRHKAIFTFNSGVANGRGGNTQTSFTLAINELNDTFLGFYSFTPRIYINDFKYIFSTDITSTSTLKNIYIHDVGNYGTYYGTIYNSYIKFIMNEAPQYTKVIDNLVWDSQAKNGIININDDTWKSIRVTNDYQNTDVITLSYPTNIKRKERSWQLAIPRNRVLYTSSNSPDIYTDLSVTAKPFAERMRDKYASIELTYTNTSNYQLLTNNIRILYRISPR